MTDSELSLLVCSLLHTSEVRFKVTLAMAPAQRPRGILGFWSTLITSLGNTDEMPVCAIYFHLNDLLTWFMQCSNFELSQLE